MEFFISWLVLVLGMLPYSVILVRLALCIIGVQIRLYLFKKRVPSFSVYCWIRSIIGRGFLIIVFSLPLLLLQNTSVYSNSMWGRFLFNGSASFIWVLSLTWVIGMTINEKCFIKEKVKSYFFSSNR